jgi:hypothetical protein
VKIYGGVEVQLRALEDNIKMGLREVMHETGNYIYPIQDRVNGRLL